MTNILEIGRVTTDERLNHTETGTALEAADQRAIARQKPTLTSEDLTELVEYGEVVARSQMFGDMKTTAQAVVKLSIGRELGLTKTASLTGVHVFQTAEGTRVIIAGQLILAKINSHPDYRVEIIRSDRKACWLQPWKRGGLLGKGDEFELLTPRCFECEGGSVVIGEKTKTCPNCAGAGHVPVRFTIEDAELLGLTGKKNWKGDPESMLLWRCVAKTQRRYFADVLAIGQAYVEGEIDYEDVNLPKALGVAAAAPVVTVQRPRRASEAPLENAINLSGTFATTVIGPDGLTDAERGAEATEALEAELLAKAEDDTPREEEPPVTAANVPSAAELEICEGGTVINRKCDQCNEKLALKSVKATSVSAKTCPKCKTEFAGLFCPGCMSEEPKGKK